MVSPDILIRGARHLLTLRGSKLPRCGRELKELGVISDGAVLIRNGKIEQIGPTRRLENLEEARNAVEISAAGRVVMPGFVDSHTHLVFPSPGTPPEEIEDAARAVRAGTGQRLQCKTQAFMQGMARHGTTTVEAKTGCGPDESAEMKLLRVMESLRRDPLHLTPTFLFRLPRRGETGEDGVAAAVDWLLTELLPKIQRRRSVQFADLAWEDDPSRREYFARYLDTARQLHLPCKIHAETALASEAIGMAILHMAVAIDHLESATPADVELLRNTGMIVSLLPCTAFCNGGRDAPARALIEAGVAVALGTDFNPQHAPNLSMQTVVALASQRLGMTPEEAISAATINGAFALGCADRVGSLEVGKSADLLLLNCSDYRDLTLNLGMNLVHMTMKSGQFIYKEGKVEPQAARDFSSVPAWD